MHDTQTIFMGVLMFTTVVMTLVIVILFAKSKLVASGPVQITVRSPLTISSSHLPVEVVVLVLSAKSLSMRAVAISYRRNVVTLTNVKPSRVSD
jgi:Na+-transporting NADH:ubiquinone oxidoreductase subunit NqrF